MHVVSAARLETSRQHFEELAELHLSTVEALALAIDAKDQTATAHIRRVQRYAAAVAQAVGMSPAEVQGVRTAALLHDIGKLAVPEHILSKPGPLTEEEFRKVQIHPQIGAEIIAAVPFPYPVAPLILSHHERWDGKGYPRGLQGDQIPLGARILTVVDYFDALTCDRPYHAAVSDAEAVATIQGEAAAALDPTVVGVFVDMLPQLRADASQAPEPTRQFSFAGRRPARPGAAAADETSTETTVFQEIAHAHREIYALYDIAQSMGTGLGVSDTMSLIASKLRHVVPFSSCALFFYDANSETFGCRFSTGVDAELLRPLVIEQGEGVVGWVGANRRPLLNARPQADFEASGLSHTTTALCCSLVCPLTVRDRLVGTLAVYATSPAAFTDNHRRLLDRVSEQAAGVISNALVFEQAKHDSLTDPLTGLPNARFMFAHLPREFARAARLNSEVSVLVLDLDDFKSINDRFGHPVGDRALRDIARAMRGAIRPYDSCVRYAGDEFVIVLPGCGPEAANLKRIELQRRAPTTCTSKQPRAMCWPSAAASGWHRFRPTATPTKRCSPRQTAACTTTRLTANCPRTPARPKRTRPPARRGLLRSPYPPPAHAATELPDPTTRNDTSGAVRVLDADTPRPRRGIRHPAISHRAPRPRWGRARLPRRTGRPPRRRRLP